MNKLDKIKFGFRKNVDDEYDLESYGQFRIGLTSNEIKNYLRARSNTLNVERLVKKFNKIAGCNTQGIFQCELCDCSQGLMYRWDVLRFADVLFGKTKGTYFD